MSQTQTREVQKYIATLAYPCSREDLATHARMNGANDDIVQIIQGLPYDFFASPYDVRDAINE